MTEGSSVPNVLALLRTLCAGLHSWLGVLKARGAQGQDRSGAARSYSWLPARTAAQEFAERFESYLDAIYREASGGRAALAKTILEEMLSRGATSILDCAAGTGFPALDLKNQLPEATTIHASDASTEMLSVFRRQARTMKIDPLDLAPPHKEPARWLRSRQANQLEWSELSQLRETYDYVLCRGNSLVYAQSWSPGESEVASEELIRFNLNKIVERVQPGGYLHIDAPWRLGLTAETYTSDHEKAPTISEQVFTEEASSKRERRRWQLSFTLPSAQRLEFEVYSSPMTIFDVQNMLGELDFQQTEPFVLNHERPSLGVIIARKPD